MVHCCVPQCANSTKNTKGKAISFHVFPRKPYFRKKWIISIRRDPGPDFNLSAKTVVCSEHFKSADFLTRGYTSRRKLFPNSVPSVFPWISENKRCPPKERPVPVEKSACGAAVNCDETLTTKSSEVNTAFTEGAITSAHDHDYDVPSQSIQDQLEAAQKEIKSLSSEVQILRQERSFYFKLSKDKHLVQFYTGFRDYDLLITFYQTIEPTAESMTRYAQYRRLSSGESKSMRSGFAQENIALVDQFLLLLRKLRVGTYDQELADFYNVSVSTIGRVLTSWVNYLYFVLGSQPLWPTKSQVKEHMPEIFKSKYPDVRVILDCTELRIQTPSSLYLNSECYSHYKSHTTLKGLIGISPAGAVTFVSKLFPGSASDKAITRSSGILDLIEAGDHVMVDKGFVISDLLGEVGASLVIPPFLTNARAQFTEKEVTETQEIARLRIHVERAIRRVKTYHVFDRIIPLTLAGTVNQMWSVSCLMTNFMGDLF